MADSWLPNTNQRMLQKHMMHTPSYPLLHPVFKNISLKAIGEFESFEPELHLLLAWPCTERGTVLHHSLQEIGFTVCQ